MARPLFIYADYDFTADVVATGIALGQVATDILQADEDTHISPAGTSLTITIDLATPAAFGCLGIAGEKLNGVILEIRGSTDNFAGSDVLVSAATPLSGFTSAWVKFTSATFRYWRLIFTTATPTMKVYHVALSPLRLLPFLASGDIDRFQTTANHIVSPQGHFLGSQKVKCESKLNLEWGVVMNSQYPLFVEWSAVCVENPRAFFFVPDSAYYACRFGYTESNYTFSAPIKEGRRTLAPIPFISRKP